LRKQSRAVSSFGRTIHYNRGRICCNCAQGEKGNREFIHSPLNLEAGPLSGQARVENTFSRIRKGMLAQEKLVWDR